MTKVSKATRREDGHRRGRRLRAGRGRLRDHHPGPPGGDGHGAAPAGAAGRPVPLRALGVRRPGTGHVHVRRPRGGVRGRGRLPGRCPGTAPRRSPGRSGCSSPRPTRWHRSTRSSSATSPRCSRPEQPLHRHGLLRREEAVLGGEQGGGGAVGDADLGVDVLDVVRHGLARDHQLVGDLLVGVPTGEQGQDVDLARRQPGQARPLAGAVRWPAALSTASTAGPSRRPARDSALRWAAAAVAVSGSRCGRGSRSDW